MENLRTELLTHRIRENTPGKRGVYPIKAGASGACFLLISNTSVKIYSVQEASASLSPNASVGQVRTHAGLRPCRRRSIQPSHFINFPSFE